MDLETDFYYMILLKKRNYFKYHYFKKRVFKPYSSIYYLTQWGLIPLNYFSQDLTGRLLVLTVYAGPVLHRLLYVYWFSLHFVLNSSCCSSECLGLYFMWLHLLLIVMYYLKSIVLCFRQAICNVCIFMTWILWVVCFIIAFDKCYSAKNF